MNRELGIFGGDNALSRSNPVSHTFVVVQNSDGMITTYSWGNEAKGKNKKGKWHKNKPEDVKTAMEAIKGDKAEKVGDESLDPFTKKAFESHANDPNDPSNHVWTPFNQCKTEAASLVDEAKKMQEESGKEEKELQEFIENAEIPDP